MLSKPGLITITKSIGRAKAKYRLLSTRQMTFGVFEFTAVALLCNVLCREGVQSTVVYLGGFSIRG